MKKVELGQTVRLLDGLYVIREIRWGRPLCLGLAPFPPTVTRFVDGDPIWNEEMSEWRFSYEKLK